MNNRTFFKWLMPMVMCVFWVKMAAAQTTIVNIESRQLTSLNGAWNVIIDPTGIGDWRKVWLEEQPQKKTDFYEYSFEGAPTLNVPGDFNSQQCELTYFEGTVWYRKQFPYAPDGTKRVFIHFGAVNYRSQVYLNGQQIGSHQGGFTPFQFEITHQVKEGINNIVVKVDNRRLENGVPGLGFDWLNFGGITREVNLIQTPATFIGDYFIQLKKGSLDTIKGWVALNGDQQQQNIQIKIPELNFTFKTTSDNNGLAEVEFINTFHLWSPGTPKLYEVIIESETDTVIDYIGFRSIEVAGNQVWLNKEPVFLKGVNIHEENPYTGSRAWSKEDAKILLNAAKELGCNMVRLAHYPHSQHMIREAEKMGMMVWTELPVYQHIKFSDIATVQTMESMLDEMIRRDKNRCATIIWGLSNETYPSTSNRDIALSELTKKSRQLDDTRLIVHVANTQGYRNNTFHVWDTLYKHSDIIAINEYIGWYIPWQGKPSETQWSLIYPDKPVLISEFGGEALYGNHEGPKDEAAYWTEDYLENIYRSQVEMFATVPNLVGVCPWLLFDYKSPGRLHPVYQKGYNRKGLLSENGEKKKAWYIMNDYFRKK
jgi:beta-glucuronidase